MAYMKSVGPRAGAAGSPGTEGSTTCINDNILTGNTIPRQTIAAGPVNCTPAILDNNPLLTPRCSSRTTPENSAWSGINFIHPEMSTLKNAQSLQDILDAAALYGSGPPPSAWGWLNAACPEPLTPPAITSFDGKCSIYHQNCPPKVAHPELDMFGYPIT